MPPSTKRRTAGAAAALAALLLAGCGTVDGARAPVSVSTPTSDRKSVV